VQERKVARYRLAISGDLERCVHSRFVSIAAIAVVSFSSVFWKIDANANDGPVGQEILIECPIWEWEPSAIPNVEYEICFDDIQGCTAANIGDKVCILNHSGRTKLGVHDVWITAIEYRGGETIYYDGDIVSVARVNNADFDGDGVVTIADFGLFTKFLGQGNKSSGDLDGDGVVGISDLPHFSRAFGKCVNASKTLYEPC
jgi:hypothetical protein